MTYLLAAIGTDTSGRTAHSAVDIEANTAAWAKILARNVIRFPSRAYEFLGLRKVYVASLYRIGTRHPFYTVAIPEYVPL